MRWGPKWIYYCNSLFQIPNFVFPCVREQWTVGVKVSEYICLLEGFQWKFAKTLGTQNARDDVLSWFGWPDRNVATRQVEGTREDWFWDEFPVFR